MTWRRFWRAYWATFLVAETVAIKSGDPEAPYSPTARHDFRLDTKAGRVAFCAGWAALTVYLLPHLCRGAAKASHEIISS